ncbi:MAG: ribosome small subunit-dependent GTPase A [Peptococcaceae bacterium]|nr:ribosome small subunit-dependent GTPase A [Peptococcaceae bacterium]
MHIEGILIKGYAGFYYVYADDRVWECSLRGRFRVKKQDFIPGDKVLILPGVGNKATIEKVMERRNSLVRPNVANVDRAFLVFARKMPDPDYNLLDRLLIQVGKAGLQAIIIFTKEDLTEDLIDPFHEYYRACGYTVLNISNKTLKGIDEVKKMIKGHITVFAGPSGSGKSSLLNCLQPHKEQKTGAVSAKIGRGRHTTRHVELIPVEGGLVADTPGFSTLYLPEMKREELQLYFPEFEKYKYSCRFKSCLHDKEPDCAVKEALAESKILSSRYKHYIQFLQEVIANENRH